MLVLVRVSAPWGKQKFHRLARKIWRLTPSCSFSLSAQVFHANADATEVVLNRIPQPVLARFVRIRPQTWKNGIALRFELYGCQITGKNARKRSCTITCQYVMIYERWHVVKAQLRNTLQAQFMQMGYFSNSIGVTLRINDSFIGPITPWPLTHAQLFLLYTSTTPLH